ncbi:MAG: S8 family peptidase, partial [Chitinophagales bacterium]
NPIAFRTSGTSVIQNQKWDELQIGNSALKTEEINPTDYGNAFHQINMLHGDDLHDKGFLGQGMIIAQLDGGWYNMPLLDVFDSLRNDYRLLGMWNFVDQNDTVYSFATHGTEVLAFMAANKPGEMIGTAPKASFYLFLTEDVFSEFPIEEHNWAAAAEAADSLGADIISCSLGYTEFTDPTFSHTYADMNGRTCMSSRAAVIAARTGMIVCSAAGNDGQKPWHYISAPADADSIITVGATDSTGTITAFSSHGPTSDGRVKPDVVAQGIRAWTIDPAPENNTTFPGNGTSFSCPIIAGMVACLWQAHQDKNNMQIIDAIHRSASLYYNPNDSFGYGIPNFQLADLILNGNSPDSMNANKPLVYPNPFSGIPGIVYFETSQHNVEVEIFDIIGRKMISYPFTMQTGFTYLPMEIFRHAANGAYFVRVKFPDHTDVLRVVKNQP